MNLKEFRDQFPNFKPNALCRQGKPTGNYLEIISWPYEDDNGIFIQAREIHDPTTMRTYRIDGEKRELYSLKAKCVRDNTIFVPIIASGKMINCPCCLRGYYQEEGTMDWKADRLLLLKPII